MTQNKVKEIITFLVSKYEGEANIRIGISDTTLYLPLVGDFCFDDSSVLAYNNEDEYTWISYDSIDFIDF